jgi:acetaldehyde dehydrogenase
MADRIRVGIVGTGNIGTDLLEKLRRSESIEPAIFAGIDPDSPGIARAQSYGVRTSTVGVDAVLEMADELSAVYEATSAAVHKANAPRYEEVGLLAIDLTPAKLGPPVVPAVNIGTARDSPNVNLTTCGGQATTPMVAAVSEAADVSYAEIVSTIASASAGPGTRQNIDEFTQTTAEALGSIGGARLGKAIIILNPAEPPMLMRNAVVCIVEDDSDPDAIIESIQRMTSVVQQYVPGYRIAAGPDVDQAFDDGKFKVSVFLEVMGAGDFLPPYAGNLDIMTAAAVAIGERLATRNEVTA